MQTVATSLKLPLDLKKEINRLAAAEQRTPHAYMLRAVEASVREAQREAAWIQSGLDSLEEMNRTGISYSFDDVEAYFLARLRGEDTPQPPPKKATVPSVAAKTPTRRAGTGSAARRNRAAA